MKESVYHSDAVSNFEASLVDVRSHTTSESAVFHFCIWQPDTDLSVDVSGETEQFKEGRFLSEEEANQYLATLLGHDESALHQALEAIQSDGRVTIHATSVRRDTARSLGWNNPDPYFRAR